MPACWWFMGDFTPPQPAAPRVGHPKRDRSAVKAARRAARRNR